MAHVVWTDPGTENLKEIVEYLAQYSPAKAETVSAQLLRAAERLEQFPLMGRVVPEFGRESLRELIVRPYRLIYQNHADECQIVAVIHSSRDLKAIFRPPQLEDDDSPS